MIVRVSINIESKLDIDTLTERFFENELEVSDIDENVEFDKETELHEYTATLDVDFNGSIDIRKCSSSQPYFDTYMGQWYPGEVNWDPIIKYDSEKIKQSIMNAAEIENEGSVTFCSAVLLGDYEGIQMEEELSL